MTATRSRWPAGDEPILRVHMSSGTTGAPIVNPYTAADVQQWREVMARSLVAAGVTADDVILVTASFGLFTGGFGFQFGAEALGAMTTRLGRAAPSFSSSSCGTSGRRCSRRSRRTHCA